MKLSDEHKRKIGDGVRRHYANMSVEDNELRKQRISDYRHMESKAYKFLLKNKELVKRLYDEIYNKDKDADTPPPQQ